MPGEDDYYALLGIAVEADTTELRRIWRQLALQWHPDRAGAAATAVFQQLSVAYETLSNPTTRALYDRTRGIVARGSTAAPPGSHGDRAPAILLARVSGLLHVLLAQRIARRIDDVVELNLAPDEARSGGMVTITFAIPVPCPWCADATFSGCSSCGDLRMIEELSRVWLAVRPGVCDGAVLSPSTQLPELLRPILFRARIR